MADCTFLDSCIVSVDSETKALLLLSLNIVAPGSGTLISAFMDEQFNFFALLCGLLQFAFAVLVIGWLWSVMHGYAIYITACQQGSKIQRPSSEEDDLE